MEGTLSDDDNAEIAERITEDVRVGRRCAGSRPDMGRDQ